MSVTTRIETLTPKKAQEYLKGMASNRPHSESVVMRYAESMLAGEWKKNGESLKFDENNRMQDGQHRCLSVIRSGVTIETAVVRGIDNDSFDTIDRGKPRSIGQIFARHGEMNTALLAATVAWLWRYNKGDLSSGRQAAPRYEEAFRLLEANPLVRDSVHFVGASKELKQLATPSLMAFFHYIFSKIDAVQANTFFNCLKTGEHLSKSSPLTSGILLLRNRMIENCTSKAKLPVYEIIPLTIKAWNAMRCGKVIKTLRYGMDEEFPAIR